MNVNIYNPYVREELYLMHHGIAGQKWGKRNGPPYPLSAGAHSASEKKAGWRKSLADGREELKTRKLLKSIHKFAKMLDGKNANSEKAKKLREKIREEYIQRITTDELKTLINNWEEYNKQEKLFEEAADRHVSKYKNKGREFRNSLLLADETWNYSKHLQKYPDSDFAKRIQDRFKSYRETYDYANKISDKITDTVIFNNPSERNLARNINRSSAYNLSGYLNKELDRRTQNVRETLKKNGLGLKTR